MSGTNSPQGGLTRRSFLKTTAAVAGATALVGGGSFTAFAAKDQLKDSDGSKVYTCTCAGNCNGGCFMQVHVKDGKAFDITKQKLPVSDYESICQRGLSHLQRIYDPLRVQYPMRRVGARGEGEWERISWDDAIAEICDKWSHYRQQYGHKSILFSMGSGNGRPDTEANGIRLAAYLGACTLDKVYDNNGMMSYNDTIGYGAYFLGSDVRDLVNAKNIIMWGSNFSESQGVRWHWVKKAMNAGARLTVIDPNFTVMASKADEFVSIRPGSDGLLAIAMMQIIVSERLVDSECLATRTVAPFLVKEDGTYLRQSDLQDVEEGAADEILVMDLESGQPVSASASANPILEGSFVVAGKRVTTAYSMLLERIGEWDMETISRYCDISESKIRELALMFADGPTSVITAYGLDHYVNGFTAYSNIVALLLVSGNIAKPGAGVNGMGAPCPFGANSSFVGYPSDAEGTTSLCAPYVPEMLKTKKYGDMDIDLKSLYLWSHNILHNESERAKWLEAFDAIEYIVVADVFMTETAQYADLVLPVPHYFELEGYHAYGTYYMKINEAAVEPMCEAKGDFEIFALIGAGMGFSDKFQLTRDEFNRKSFENDTAKMMGITWDKLKEEKFIYSFNAEPYVHGADGFPTATGRAQFYFENVRPYPDLNQEWDARRESLPYWEPPHEAWFENELYQKYPLQFTTERAKFKVHSQFSHVPELLEIDPEPTVKINPADAESRNIATGDIVKVFNDRGYVVCRAVLNSGNRPGVLVMDHGWHEDQFIEGHYQNLSSIYTHPHFASVCPFDCLAEVEKVEGN